ncbi:DUF2336 domain-containing protein [Aerophototrophica crusticola]|uniref:DUF2336 domain-containing protein n=1 Tax=Aerophototrophica crusticola TaxID=1709002 RepID=A0A858R491_9PROT|nr:DUF2336 domain-containing protein [Rhodospirillaceae bacterium B3]
MSDLLPYEQAKALAAHPDPSVRGWLATRPDVQPELLFFLAEDPDVGVRRAIAGNDATPVQAARRLSRDADADVRRLLGAKLARALPHLTGAELASLRDLAHQVLNDLAADQVVRVRAALASTLADVEVAPPRLVARLARDVSREVAEPVLRTCVTLTDEELLSIIASQPLPWVLEAIARRPTVSQQVADRLEATGDPDALAALHANPGAPHSPGTGTALVEVIPPPPVRSGLPATLTGRIAEVVGSGIRDELAAEGFDREARDTVVAVTGRRLDWARGYADREPPEKRALRLMEEGTLDEEAVWDALSWGDMTFTRAALALKARIPLPVVQRILDTQGPKAITALAWKAGLSMRCARALQAKAGVPPRKLLNARHGTDYPLGEVEMLWQLELFGISG